MARRSRGNLIYAVKRAGQAVPLILAILLVNFTLIQVTPGDPVIALGGEFPIPDEHRQRLIEDFGLDQSVPKQFIAYIGNVLTGNLGFSFVNRQPVLDLILSRAGRTALLLGTAMLVATVVGVSLGVLAGLRSGRWSDTVISSVGVAGYAMPVFWLGQLLIIFFALTLGWFPAGGIGELRGLQAEGAARIAEVLRFLTLPALALSVRYIAINMRITRTSIIEAMQSNYIQTAIAKGLSRRRVVVRHGLRNALLPVVTIIGYNLGFALSGSVLVETVFAWPGIGRLLFTSIIARDHPVILGIFLVVTASVIIANLITDIVYTYIDPRIRY